MYFEFQKMFNVMNHSIIDLFLYYHLLIGFEDLSQIDFLSIHKICKILCDYRYGFIPGLHIAHAILSIDCVIDFLRDKVTCGAFFVNFQLFVFMAILHGKSL